MADESIWKKEISFGRKRKEEAPASDAEATPGSDEPTSMWKKEISFGRKKKPAETPESEAEVAAEALDEEPESEQTWTRAVSFGRKAHPETEPVVEEPVAEEPVAREPVAREPAWTKEVSFSRAPAQPEGAVEPGPQSCARSVVSK